MKFSDILDLARQGYKPSDIKEFLSINTDNTEPEPKPDPEPDPKPEPDPEPELDYKKMYEDTLKKLDALQKANQRQQIEEHKDSVNDIIRDVFY